MSEVLGRKKEQRKGRKAATCVGCTSPSPKKSNQEWYCPACRTFLDSARAVLNGVRGPTEYAPKVYRVCDE